MSKRTKELSVNRARGAWITAIVMSVLMAFAVFAVLKERRYFGERVIYKSVVTFAIEGDSLNIVDCRYVDIVQRTTKDSLFFDMPNGEAMKYKLIRLDGENIYTEGRGSIQKFIVEIAGETKKLYFRPTESTYVVLSTDSTGVCK